MILPWQCIIDDQTQKFSAIDISLYWIGSNYLNFSFILFFSQELHKVCFITVHVKRLLWNQLVISVITELILFLNSSGLVFDIIMLFSSTNSIRLICSCLKKGHLYIQKNSNGPNTKPCGTPCFTCTYLEDNLLGYYLSLIFSDIYFLRMISLIG